MDGLLRQVSEMAAPGSRMCFDALHRDHMDGRVRNRGFSCGLEVGVRFEGSLWVPNFSRRWKLIAEYEAAEKVCLCNA